MSTSVEDSLSVSKKDVMGSPVRNLLKCDELRVTFELGPSTVNML